MFSLLKITVTGYKMLCDNFTVDFLTKAKVNEIDLNSEVMKVDTNLYKFTSMAFTGSNSSGKTTILTLIYKCLTLMRNGRWQYFKQDFANDHIDLNLKFFLNGIIYDYSSKIEQAKEEDNDSIISFCKINNEKIKSVKYSSIHGKRYEKCHFIEKDFSSGMDDTSSLKFLCKDNVKSDFVRSDNTPYNLVSKYFWKLFSTFDTDLTLSVIKLLDDSIESLEVKDDDWIEFKRINHEKVKLNMYEFNSLLSNGTKRGIELYIRVIRSLKSGSTLIIDEIENCFHKNLVDNIIFLYNDKTINKNNAQLIFSTHYVEILDVFDRRDNISIAHKENCRITLSNLYEDYGSRVELRKSKLFNNNTFGTLLNYDNLMLVKRNIKDETINND